MAGIAMALSALSVEASDRAPDGLRLLRQQGWTANLFVKPAERHGIADDASRVISLPTTVNLRAWRRLSKSSRVAIEFTNLLDRDARPSSGNSLPDPVPVPGRGIFLRFGKTF